MRSQQVNKVITAGSVTRRMLVIAASALLLAACQSASLTPVELVAEDMCASCKMAISEKQYAAEALTPEGDAYKFDDLGCLVDFIAAKKNKAPIAAYFVVDLESKQWLKAEDAHFVSSAKFRTPMGGGIVAFKDQAQAQEAATANGGKMLSFAAVINRTGKAGE